MHVHVCFHAFILSNLSSVCLSIHLLLKCMWSCCEASDLQSFIHSFYRFYPQILLKFLLKFFITSYFSEVGGKGTCILFIFVFVLLDTIHVHAYVVLINIISIQFPRDDTTKAVMIIQIRLMSEHFYLLFIIIIFYNILLFYGFFLFLLNKNFDWDLGERGEIET